MHKVRKSKLIVTTLSCFAYLVLCSFIVFADDNQTQQVSLSGFNVSQEIVIDDNKTSETNTTFEGNQTIESNQTSYVNQSDQNITIPQENKTKKVVVDQIGLDQGGKQFILDIQTTPQTYNTAINSDASPYNFVSYGGKLLLKANALGEVAFYYLDFLGNTRGISDDIGNVISSKNYLLFGEQIDNLGQNSGKAYTSKEQDLSDLYYFGARYYNPSIGRFVSVDPKLDYTQSPYVYVKDNPLKYIDPDGKKAQLIGAGISDNTKIQQLYFGIGSRIPRVNSIIFDSYDHILANKDATADYTKIYLRKENEAKLAGRGMDGVTVNRDLSLIDVKSIKSYGFTKDIVILHQLFHESIHQADIISFEEKGKIYNTKSTPEIELSIENEMFNSLGLKNSYNDQLKDENSWVVTNQISKKEYKDIVSVTRAYMEHYQALVEKELKRDD